jgi:hypothetical protein
MSTNLFRFVAVRPPRLEESEVERRLENPGVGKEFVDEVERRRKEHGESLPAARRAVGAKLLASGEYFTNDELWQRFRPSLHDLATLLETAARSAEWERVYRRAERIIRGVFPGETLRDWLRGETYKKLELVLWRSYYANVLADGLRPQDRPELLSWARIFRFLEVFRDEDEPPESDEVESRPRFKWLAALAKLFGGDDRADQDEAADPRDRRLRALAGHMLRARLRLAVGLFQEPTPPEEEPGEPREQLEASDPVAARVTELGAAITRAEQARGQLEDVYRAKLQQLRQRAADADAVASARGRPPAAHDNVDDREAGGTGGSPASTGAPWRLTAADIEGHQELAAELAALRLRADGLLVPEVASGLDGAIARHTAELQELVSASDVVGFGRTLAVISRTVRRPDTRRTTVRSAPDVTDPEAGR